MTWKKAALLVFSLFLLLNLLVLDIRVFTKKREQEHLPGVPQPFPICPAACLDIISEATASALTPVTPIPKPATARPTVKEFYVPLGTGSTTSTSWTELTGVESVIDMANYPRIKSIIFEASMRIPTANGRVYAKLYNVIDKHDVWYSEVYAEGSSGYRAESRKITLSSGRKLYRVMMKSTMGYEAILDSARIKILLE